MAVAAEAGGPRWQRHAPLPEPRTEVAAAVAGDRIVVVGGFVDNGANSARADAYPVANEPVEPPARSAGRGGSRRRGERSWPGLHRRRLRGRSPAAPQGLRARERGLAGAARSAGGPRGSRRRRLAGEALRRRRARRAGARAGRARARPAHRTLVAHPGADAARASGRGGRQGPRLCGRRPQRRHRHEHQGVRGVRPEDAALDQARTAPLRPRGHGRDGGHAARSSRSGASNRRARSRASTPTTSARRNGGGCRICPRRGTAWASSRTTAASSRSGAARSRA